ncbi:hypothetical protein DFS34DRAFT_636848 [Phlyctochytrium arcticum]|nr:hypothetical protein DFS34DRAFT_636848 [Phlyctochytrium arcticum]
MEILIKNSNLVFRGVSSILEKALSYTEGNETRGSAADKFREKLVAATMGKSGQKFKIPKELRCSLSGITLPSNHIIAGHLFKHAWENFKWIVDLEDINDVRNGLLLYKPIERAFDNGFICFIYENGTFTCRLLCKQWKLKTLDSYHPELQPGTQLTAPMTFGDIDGKPLLLGLIQPFKRCLWFQASQARKKALRKGWIKEDELEIPDFGSEGDYVETVKSYLDGVMAAGVSGREVDPDSLLSF